jgi:hypothetical protein
LGSDVKNRDAVIVYPHGKGSYAVEVPLKKTPKGYRGERMITWADLGKLNDEGTSIDVAVFDHDKGSESEEMHVSVAISTGKSCEKARDENPETMDMGAKTGGGAADLSSEQLGAPMKTDAFMRHCALPSDANADICVTIKQGKAIGVSVGVTPTNNKVAACIDKAARRIHFPTSGRIDVIHQKF